MTTPLSQTIAETRPRRILALLQALTWGMDLSRAVPDSGVTK